ncbi:MAG TPA: cupin domain-containing protein [Baekduia sp.]|nr:cupin domain-containing protein [Baekduia sp.]
MDAATVAAAWRLEPHPEGGFFRETYRSPTTVELPGWPGPRALATSILYLLPRGERSAWHRVRGDELWVWQGGAPLELSIEQDVHLLGPDPSTGQELQLLVPAGAWQSATPVAGEDQAWTLAACLVAPGFDFADFELRAPRSRR